MCRLILSGGPAARGCASLNPPRNLAWALGRKGVTASGAAAWRTARGRAADRVRRRPHRLLSPSGRRARVMRLVEQGRLDLIARLLLLGWPAQPRFRGDPHAALAALAPLEPDRRDRLFRFRSRRVRPRWPIAAPSSRIAGRFLRYANLNFLSVASVGRRPASASHRPHRRGWCWRRWR